MWRYAFIAVAVVVGVAGLRLLRADDANDEAIKKDRKLYEGTWRVVSLEVDGNKVADEDAKKIVVVNKADGSWSIRVDGKEVAKGTSKLDPTKKPKSIDLTATEGDAAGKTALGIYEIDKDNRKVCIAQPGKDRPTEFSSKAGTGHILATFKREKQ
jgi:uncharacterized protein (TIGR03067 family)